MRAIPPHECTDPSFLLFRTDMRLYTRLCPSPPAQKEAKASEQPRFLHQKDTSMPLITPCLSGHLFQRRQMRKTPEAECQYNPFRVQENILQRLLLFQTCLCSMLFRQPFLSENKLTHYILQPCPAYRILRRFLQSFQEQLS